MSNQGTWKVIYNADGDFNVVAGFNTKKDAIFHASCTRCSDNQSARKIVSGYYEYEGRDIITNRDEPEFQNPSQPIEWV